MSITLSWKYFSLVIEYGYFGNYCPVSINCFSDGGLHFEDAPEGHGSKPLISDKSQRLEEGQLQELNIYVQKFLAIEKVADSFVTDGGSFEIKVKLNNRKVKQLQVYHSFEQEDLDRAMDQTRKLLKEEYFLKKHKEDLSPHMVYRRR